MTEKSIFTAFISGKKFILFFMSLTGRNFPVVRGIDAPGTKKGIVHFYFSTISLGSIPRCPGTYRG